MNFNSVMGIKAPETQAPAQVQAAESAAARQSKSEAKIQAYFQALGIEADEIRPRENVLTFQGWLNKGRVVEKGQHGCKLSIWKQVPKVIKNQDGSETTKTVNLPWYYTVFHFSQTKEKVDKVTA